MMEEKVEELIDIYKKQIYSLCYKLAKTKEDAEEKYLPRLLSSLLTYSIRNIFASYIYQLILLPFLQDAEDIFQETWIKVFSSRHQLSYVENYKKWITTIKVGAAMKKLLSMSLEKYLPRLLSSLLTYSIRNIFASYIYQLILLPLTGGL
jgi:DNA-directed RNA polymerase specialized sigma24 family protein